MNERIGFVGLGLMGMAMARRLLGAGYPLSVYNRSREKATNLGPQVTVASSPAEVAWDVPIVFSMLSTSEVLHEVALGSHGILKGLGTGGIHIDCSTVAPSTTSMLERRYTESGRAFIHCPVLGSVPQATGGSLLLMAGGSPSGLQRAEKVLRVLGTKIWRFERADQASHAKLLCNSFIAGMITTLSQALVVAQRVEVASETLLDIIGNSALNAPTYQSKGKSILARDFTPRFYAEHMLKDVSLMIEAARESGTSVPGLEVTQALYQRAVSLGLGKEDYSSIVKVLEESSPAK